MHTNSRPSIFPLTWEELQREPYRILFPLGLILVAIGIGVWIPYYFWPQSFPYPGQRHAVYQIQGFLLCFILGFLTTMLPKVLGVRPLGRLQLLLFPLGFLLLAVCSWINSSQTQKVIAIIHLFLIGNFLVFILRRWPERKGSPPSTFLFIPMAIFCDITGTILKLLIAMQITNVGMLRLSSLLQNQAFPLLLILGIGGFLLPKLFASARVDPQALRNQPNHSLVFPLALGSGLILSFIIESSSPHFINADQILRLAYLIRAGIWFWFTLGQLNLFRIPKKLPGFLAGARIALLSIGLGMTLPIFWPAYLIAWEHLVFISGFLWLTLSIASRVMTAHGGRLEILDQHQKKMIAFGILIVFGLSSRISTDIWTRGHWLHLACASAFVLIALGIWGRIFVPLIFLVPAKQ